MMRCAISMVDAYSIRNFLPDAASKAGITLSNTRCIPIVTRPRGSSARAVGINDTEFAIMSVTENCVSRSTHELI